MRLSSLCLRTLFGITVMVVSGCSSPTSPDTTPVASNVQALSGIAAQIAELTNRERAAAGLSALRVETRLVQAAQLQADQMAATRQLEHVLPGARYPRLDDRLAAANYRWTTAAENLAAGQQSASAVMAEWMLSSTHRAAILAAEFTELGIGSAVDASGRTYYVQVFARP
jgi:uncharacterized protein YkwD